MMSKVLRKSVLDTLSRYIGKHVYINGKKVLLKSVSWIGRYNLKINDNNILFDDIDFGSGEIYLYKLSRWEDETYFKDVENETIIKYR